MYVIRSPMVFPTFPFYLLSIEVEEVPEVYSSKEWRMKGVAGSPALWAATLVFIEYFRDQPINSVNEEGAYVRGPSNTQTVPETHRGGETAPWHKIFPDLGIAWSLTSRRVIGVGTYFVSRLQRCLRAWLWQRGLSQRDCQAPVGTWSSRQGEGWANFYWAWLNLDSEKEKRHKAHFKDRSRQLLFVVLKVRTLSFKLLFSFFSWKGSEPKLKMVASRHEADFSVGEFPISDWPRWDLGAGSAWRKLRKRAQYLVVYSTRMDGPFLDVRTCSGSWKFRGGKDAANPDLSGHRNWCQREYTVK